MPEVRNGSIIALDVGTVRIGVAVASRFARIPRALPTLLNDDTLFESLSRIVKQEGVDTVVLGLPRGLSGQNTAQTAYVQAFLKKLQSHIDLPVSFQDEALTSIRAESELKERSKPFTKADIDALAATYILEDFLHDTSEGM